MNTDEVINGVTRVAGMNDRWLFVASLVVFGVFLLLAVAGQLLISRFGETDRGLSGRSVLFSEHLRAFLGYCKAAGLVPDLRQRRWASFALGYNGAGYRSVHYDTKLGTAYAHYARSGS